MSGVRARIKAVCPTAVLPLVYDVPRPIPGESLLGFVTRCIRLTAIDQTNQALSLAGIAKINPCPIATTMTDEEAQGLATRLRTPLPEIRRMMHSSGTFDHSRSETVDFFGVRIRADYREKRIRRVSPRALAKAPYHRAVWDLRVFSFDPETHETLIETCPVCGNELGWTRSRGVDMCDVCVDQRGRPNVCLADFPQDIVQVDDEEALRFVTGLIEPDPERRQTALRLVPAPWSRFTEEILFETAIAFACALTMSSDHSLSTLERPKRVSEYARFTPKILAAAGRAIIGGRQGFDAVADRIRAAADSRQGHYGVKKELGPLFCMTADQHLPREIKKIIKAMVAADMERTKSAVLRRADYAPDEGYLPLEALATETGLRRKRLARLADSGHVPVIRAARAALSPVLMPVDTVLALAVESRDAVHWKFAAGRLAIAKDVLDDLVARELIRPMTGPVLGLFESAGPYFSKESVEKLLDRIMQSARARDRPENGMRIPIAVKRLAMKPVPWAAVIAAIVDGTAPVQLDPQRQNDSWVKALRVADVEEFVRTVGAKTTDTDRAALEEWIGIQTVAEMLKVTVNVVYSLTKARKIVARGFESYRLYRRSAIEAFAKKYIFAPEIMQLAGIRSARRVRPWLAGFGYCPKIQPRPNENRNYAYLRAEFEQALKAA